MKNKLIVSCFFLSGFTGLVYEVAWIRRASLVMGSTTWALSTVLATFFAGMALGSWLVGRWSQRVKRPIRLYGLLELGLGLAALISLPAFGWIEGIYGAAYRSAVTTQTDPTGLTWLTAGAQLGWVQVSLIALVLLVPTFLMGGTLPLFCRQFVTASDKMMQNLGALYGVNTAGAVAGTLAAGFFLIPQFGVTGAVVLAVVVNVLIGVAALVTRIAPIVDTDLVRGNTPSVDDKFAAGMASAKSGQAAGYLWPILLFFNTGLVVVGAEVFWSRFLSLVIRDSVTTYTITLAVVLSGIVLGSLAISWLDRRNFLPEKSLPRLFGTLQILSAIAIILAMFLPARWWFGLGDNLWPFFCLMLPATLFSGASFPLANRIVLADPR